MSEPEAKPAIVQWLQERGYSSEEIARILARMADHDEKTVRDAVFDSIGQGSMNLDQIIREALGK
ncbi:MAG: hypothetical protein SFU86_07350 [Pirellulaceae bacterium]|nr:hypothetical protein [Pirellulaceae bacterium]